MRQLLKMLERTGIRKTRETDKNIRDRSRKQGKEMEDLWI